MTTTTATSTTSASGSSTSTGRTTRTPTSRTKKSKSTSPLGKKSTPSGSPKLLLGQAVLASSKKYEGYVVEHERYNQKGTICVFINWDGDGIYADYTPDKLTPIEVSQLTKPMQESRLEDMKRRSPKITL